MKWVWIAAGIGLVAAGSAWLIQSVTATSIQSLLISLQLASRGLVFATGGLALLMLARWPRLQASQLDRRVL